MAHSRRFGIVAHIFATLVLTQCVSLVLAQPISGGAPLFPTTGNPPATDGAQSPQFAPITVPSSAPGVAAGTPPTTSPNPFFPIADGIPFLGATVGGSGVPSPAALAPGAGPMIPEPATITVLAPPTQRLPNPFSLGVFSTTPTPAGVAPGQQALPSYVKKVSLGAPVYATQFVEPVVVLGPSAANSPAPVSPAAATMARDRPYDLSEIVFTYTPQGKVASAQVFEYQFNTKVVAPLVSAYTSTLGRQPGSTLPPTTVGSSGDPGSDFTCTVANGIKLCQSNGKSPFARNAEIGVPDDEAHDHDEEEEVHKRGGRFIFGADNRVMVGSARNSNPYKYEGQVTMSAGACSGTLIGPKHVLTAGHCVAPGSGSKWYTDFRFYPRRDTGLSPRDPYGGFVGAYATAPTGWLKSRLYDHDWAVITLTKETGLGWMQFGYDTGMAKGWILNIMGYPGDKNGRMARASGSLSHVYTNQFCDQSIDTVRGNSGGPVYALYNEGSRVILGVVSHGEWVAGDARSNADNQLDLPGHTAPSRNCKTRLTSEKFSIICGILKDSRVC